MARSPFRKHPTWALQIAMRGNLRPEEMRVYLALLLLARYAKTPRSIDTTARYVGEMTGIDRANVSRAIKSLARGDADHPPLIEYAPGVNQHHPSRFTIIEDSEVAVVPTPQAAKAVLPQPSRAQVPQARGVSPAETRRRGFSRGDSLQESPSTDTSVGDAARGRKAAPPSVAEQIVSLEAERGLGPFEPWQREKLESVDAVSLADIVRRSRMSCLDQSRALLTEILRRIDKALGAGAA